MRSDDSPVPVSFPSSLPVVVLIDGNSLAYRAYFALIRSPLRNSKGENTSAIYGFAQSLRKLRERFHPEYFAVVFDAPGPTFRHERFHEYKIQRPKTPEELASQMPIIRQVVKAYGIRQFEEPGVEADDVLGTLAERFRADGLRVYLVTSDKDLLQLVSEQISTYDPFKDIVYNPEKVRERYGVGPERIADLLALTGDSADNIPGVPGIGPKRAQEILLKFGSLETALEQDPRVQAHQDIARISKSLTEIRTDVPMAIQTKDLKPDEPDIPALTRLFTQLEFTTILKEISAEPLNEIRIVTDQHLSAFASQEPLLGVGLDGNDCWLARSRTEVLKVDPDDPQLVRDILENQSIMKVGFDLKPLLKYLQGRHIRIGPIADAMIGGWLLDPTRKRYALEDLMLQYCGRAISPPEALSVPAHALELYDRLHAELDQMQLGVLFRDLEMPLERVLAAMETRGVRLDRRLLADFSRELAGDIDRLETDIQAQAGEQFNLRSPQQLAHVLFDRLGLKPRRKTKSGYSTDAAVLQELAGDSSLVADILKVRELTKLQSTYLEPLGRLSDPRTGRIRTSFNQTGTATGRLSTSQPNLQNVPIRTDLGRRIRAAFVAEPGFKLISADYAQIELRILAEISSDPNLKSAFASGQDIHTRTASAILHLPEKDVTPEARRIAKMVNYGLIYGMSDYGLASRLGIGRDESKAFITEYMSLYPGVARWCDTVVEQARADGFTRTLFGRIRPLPDLRSPNRQVAEAARRAAINSPIQGTAADIIKRAMITIADRLDQAGFIGGITLQIHDELLLEIEQARVEEAKTIVCDAMQSAWSTDVALQVDVGIGANWAEIH